MRIAMRPTGYSKDANQTKPTPIGEIEWETMMNTQGQAA